MALSLSTDEQKAQQRYTMALFGVVFAWSLMFAGVLFIRFTNQSSTAILPPLERAVTAASLLLPGWAFLTADHARWRKSSNTILLLLLLVIAIVYAITGIIWIEISDTMDFNLSSFGLFWTFTLFTLPVLGILLTVFLFRDVADAPLKLVYFFLIALGGGLTLYQMTQSSALGHYTGIYRMTFTLAQVMVPLLVYRVVIDQYERALEDRSIRGSTPIPPPHITTVAPAPTPEPVRITQTDALNAQLLKAMGMILESGEPDDIPARIVGTMLDILRADIGALLRLQDINYADISVAHDRMMGRKIASLSLNMDNQPTLVNAIERRSQRGLYTDRNIDELDDLFERMYIDQRGPAYFQPLTHNREVFAVILVALPYTKRELRAEEVELLKGIGSVAGSLLAVSYNAIEATKNAEDRMIQAMVEGSAPSTVQQNDVLQARGETQEKLMEARAEIQSLTKQVSELNHQLIHEHNRLASMLGDSAEDLSISQKITAITDDQIQLRDEREQLTKRLKETEAALQGASTSDNEAAVNHLIESLKNEKEILEIEKIRLKQHLEEVRSQDKAVVPADMQRLINRMMQEKDELQNERDQLGDKLGNLQLELQELGIEDDVTGLSQWISRLSEERIALKNQNDLLQKERNVLLKERKSVSTKINHEKDRDVQIESLQDKIEKLASDREIAIKQRDKLRVEHNGIIDTVNAVKEHRARLLAETSGFELEMEETREEQAKLRAQVQELANSRSHLMHERDKLIAENTAISTELEQTLSRLDGDPSRMKQINEDGVGSLKEMIEDLSQQRDELERELNLTQNNLAEIENQLKVANSPDSGKNGSTLTYEPKEPELLVGLVQELRTPMTSISGYVDLLLSESAGILGEMQRKFLQRVGANISRLDSMIDSLIHVTQLDTGNYALEPQPVDLIHLIENAITDASLQFREKGLAVTLDLDEGLPRLPADEDAMKQVIGQLLTNAYLVSPPDSEIHVTVMRRSLSILEDTAPRNCVYVAVEDSGGGINSEDVPRVFARKYKAENPLIQGLGDTGVGMSIAQALIKAHEGKLWVEMKNNMGSVFAFAIPLDLEIMKKRD